MFNAAEANSAQAFEQKVDESEAPEFTLVTTRIQTSIRNSGLYHLVEDLLPRDLSCPAEHKESLESSLLADYQISALTVDKAWLIHLDQAPENVLFSEIGFEFQGSHLRVDGLLAKENSLKAKQGFSASHYTAEYKNPHTNKLIVIHAYIGKNGITSCQIKKYKSEDDKRARVAKNLPINSISKEKIRKNAEPAIALIEKLEAEKLSRCMKAEKESYEINIKLSDVLQKILINSAQNSNRLALKAEYGVLVKSFSAVIATINRYNDQEIDKRDELLKQRYALMNRPVVNVRKAQTNEASEKPVESAGLLDKVQADVAEEGLSKKSKSTEALQLEADATRAIVLVADIKALMKKIKPLIVPQKTLAFDELIMRQALKQEVNLKLIELAFLSYATQKNNAYLQGVATKLNNIPELFEAFKQAVKNSELDSVIQLYPHVQHENLMPIFDDLIFERLVQSSGEELNKIIAMLRFFFNNSNSYHNYIILCEQEFMPGAGCFYSLLIHAFLRQNYLAFELMLNQGFNPNGVGFICEELTASVMYAIAYFMNAAPLKSTDRRYIETLLSLGALADKKTPEVASNSAECFNSIFEQKKAEKILKKQKIRIGTVAQSIKLQMEGDFDTSQLKKILSFGSTLKMLYSTGNLPRPELLELFVPESSLSSLVSALSSLINVHDVYGRFVMGTEFPYFIGCSNAMEANQIEAALLSSHECELRLVSPLGNFENEIKEKNEIIIANNNGTFVIFYKNRINGTIDNFSCEGDLEALLLSLDFNGKILVKSQESEKLYKQVYAEVRSKGGYPPSEVADKRHVTYIAYHTNPEKAVMWYENFALLLGAFCEKYHEIIEREPVQIDNLYTFLIGKAKVTEDLLDKTNLLQQALYLQLFNPQFSFQNAQKIVQTLCYLGQAYFYHRFFDPISKLRSITNFNNAFACCVMLACSKELQATPFFDFITKKLIALDALPKTFQLKEGETVVHTNSASDSKQPMGIPLTLAAQNHARQTPALSALANDKTTFAPTAAALPPVVSAEAQAKRKKKKR